MGIGVYGRMLAGPSTSSFKRVGENADPMANGISRVFVALGVCIGDGRKMEGG